jgi:hypothetical protein
MMVIGVAASLMSAAMAGVDNSTELINTNTPSTRPYYDAAKGGLLIVDRPAGSLTLSGEALLRSETWDWFGAQGDDYTFQFGRVRLNALAEYENVRLFVQPQYVYMYGLPDDAALPAPRGPSGMGGLYYLHTGEENPDALGFHQAYIEVRDLAAEGLSLKIGRMAYSDGLEHVRPEDGKKFNTLKDMRLGDRLISSFDWSAFARSFDGGQVRYTASKNLDVTMSVLYPTQGGWEEDFNRTMDDVRIAALAATMPKDSLLPGTELQGFVYNERDERRCNQRVDNTGMTASEVDIDIYTVGAHVLGLYPVGPGQLDALLWGAVQSGDWYEQDHSAHSIAAETGYQLTATPWKPWLRTGGYYGSGDSNPNDTDHGTFFQMVPGTRKYQLFPYYDLQNIQYGFVQALLFPRKDMTIRLDYTVNYLAESSDRWYMGTGPTQNDGEIYGYIGRPSGNNDRLSQDVSVMVQYSLCQYASLNLFYAHVFGGDVVENIYSEDADADYVSAELTFRF